MRKTSRIILSVILTFLMVGVLAYFGRYRLLDLWNQWMAEKNLPEPVTYHQLKNQESNVNNNVNKKPEIIIPEEINLDVPFTVQAPYAVWDERHKEACEEAAILLVHYFWQGKKFTKEIAEEELQKMIDFQIEKHGDYKDTDSKETAQLIKDLWGYKKVEVKYDITLDDIKKEVSQGRPVILPAAGRELKNPYFRRPGPLYHMVVVKGWTKDKIITNDPGTKRGENYTYDPDVLYDAVHDWNDGDIYNGRKAMIVIYPND